MHCMANNLHSSPCYNSLCAYSSSSSPLLRSYVGFRISSRICNIMIITIVVSCSNSGVLVRGALAFVRMCVCVSAFVRYVGCDLSYCRCSSSFFMCVSKFSSGTMTNDLSYMILSAQNMI